MEEGRGENWQIVDFARDFDEAYSEVGDVLEGGGKFLWIYLYICSVKWKTYTPTGETAIEYNESSNSNERGFHADGGHGYPPKQCFHGGSTSTKLL